MCIKKCILISGKNFKRTRSENNPSSIFKTFTYIPHENGVHEFVYALELVSTPII